MTITRDDPRFWDVRTIERRIRRGQTSRKDLDKYLKGLPDVVDKGDIIRVDDTREAAPVEDYGDEDDDEVEALEAQAVDDEVEGDEADLDEDDDDDAEDDEGA